MAPLRSLGNALSSFRDFYASTAGSSAASSGSSPSPISASGGNQTTATGFTNGGYKYHVFTSSGALTVNSGSGDIEFLVVAGGGGGGWGNGGAGGAGGLRTNDPGVPAPIRITDPVSVSPGPYTITVGDGGNSNDSPFSNRTGGNSSIGSLVVASGGGGGGPAPSASDMDGGSGGGQQGPAAGDSIASPDGLTPTVQGSAGGTRDGGGGGGGASQVDGPIQTSSPYNPSSGAAGLNCPAFSSPIIHPNCSMPSDWQTYIGSDGRYAAGGWGYPNRGSSWNPSTHEGIANTGGGADADPSPGTKGGKGIVIIRYPS